MEAIFAEGGYDSFSMAKLSKEASVVRGTLYLYFETREELFWVLYNQSLMRWSEAFIGGLGDSMSDLEYAELFYTTPMADDGYNPRMARLARLAQSIEHNVSLQSCVESKRLFINRVDLFAKATAPLLGPTLAQSTEVFGTLGVLLVGATRADQTPTFESGTPPADEQARLSSFSSKDVFVKNACRLIAAIRSGDS